MAREKLPALVDTSPAHDPIAILNEGQAAFGLTPVELDNPRYWLDSAKRTVECGLADARGPGIIAQAFEPCGEALIGLAAPA